MKRIYTRYIQDQNGGKQRKEIRIVLPKKPLGNSFIDKYNSQRVELTPEQLERQKKLEIERQKMSFDDVGL
jgi:hypothetical protein